MSCGRHPPLPMPRRPLASSDDSRSRNAAQHAPIPNSISTMSSLGWGRSSRHRVDGIRRDSRATNKDCAADYSAPDLSFAIFSGAILSSIIFSPIILSPFMAGAMVSPAIAPPAIPSLIMAPPEVVASPFGAAAGAETAGVAGLPQPIQIMDPASISPEPTRRSEDVENRTITLQSRRKPGSNEWVG